MAIKPVLAPASFVPQHAISFGETDGPAISVSASNPLPTTIRLPGSTSTPLAGSASAAMVSAGFTSELGRPIWITLSGSWSGTVMVKRSIDSGVTRLPLTIAGASWGVFTGNVQEPVGEESVAGASWFLDIVLNAGSVTYEVRQ